MFGAGPFSRCLSRRDGAAVVAFTRVKLWVRGTQSSASTHMRKLGFVTARVLDTLPYYCGMHSLLGGRLEAGSWSGSLQHCQRGHMGRWRCALSSVISSPGPTSQGQVGNRVQSKQGRTNASLKTGGRDPGDVHGGRQSLSQLRR